MQNEHEYEDDFKKQILSEISEKYNKELINRALNKLNLIKEDKTHYIFCNTNTLTSLDKIKPNQVKIFELSISDYKCSINPRGRKKYGKIEDLNFENNSKVGTKYGLLDLPEIRKNKFTKSIFEFQGENIENVVMENIKELIDEEIEEWKKKAKYTVLEYKEGDYFMEHCDQKVNKRHFGTLLIFPPSIDSFAHDGGEFVIENGNWDIIIPTKNNKNWKFVAFPIELKHACLKIKKGKRIVIKTELFKKYISNTPYNYNYEKICCDGGINLL